MSESTRKNVTNLATQVLEKMREDNERTNLAAQVWKKMHEGNEQTNLVAQVWKKMREGNEQTNLVAQVWKKMNEDNEQTNAIKQSMQNSGAKAEESMSGYRPGKETYDNRNKRLPQHIPLNIDEDFYDDSEKNFLGTKTNIMGTSTAQAPQNTNKPKFGKTKLPISRRDIYHVDIPISKSLSTRLGVGPNESIIKRIKGPKIDIENDMLYMGINYKF